jgi:hypothetical protein
MDMLWDEDECPEQNLTIPDAPFAPDEGEDGEPQPFNEADFATMDIAYDEDECPIQNL